MRLKAIGIAAALLASSSAASAATYGFTCITSGLPCTTVGTTDQARVDITNPTGSQVQFLFTNTGSIVTGISSIFFDSSLLAYGSPTIVNGTGVNFTTGSNPSNLPVGNTLNPPFVSDFAVSATPPAPQNAVEQGETLTVRLTLAPSVTYNQFLASIGGATRIGLNMTSVGGELVIDSTPIGGINPDPNVVNIPVPGALPLMVAGLIAMGAVVRRRKA